MSPEARPDDLPPEGFGPSADPKPLDDIYLDFLFEKSQESPTWDFKSDLSIAKGGEFTKVIKDFFAFANFGGGYILIGWKKNAKGVHEPIGLPTDFSLEPASMQQKFQAFCDEPIAIDYTIFYRNVDGERRKFAAIYIPPSLAILVPSKDGVYFQDERRTKKAFEKGVVYTRRGTQSIPAIPREIEQIQRRIRNDEYRIALISGRADPVQETLHSNLFPISRLPDRAFSAALREATLPSEVRRRVPCVLHGGRVYAFDDPRENELRSFILHSSVHAVNVGKWRADPDRAHVFHWLLTENIKSHCTRKGMWAQHKGDRVYYPVNRDGSPRVVNWRGLSRGGPRTVASRLWAEQFEQFVYQHQAAGLDIVEFDKKYYLEIVPTFVITWDGARPIKDERVGSVITRLLNAKYNAEYVRDMYFWVEQLETTPGRIELAQGQLQISPKPLLARVERGLLADQINIEEEAPSTDDKKESEAQ